MNKLIWTAWTILVLLAAPLAAEQLSGSGKWQSLRGEGINGEWSAKLARTGEDVRGTFSLTGSNVFSGGHVEGTVDGAKVMLGILAEGQQGASFAGLLRDDGNIEGEWSAEALNDNGVWKGTLTATGKP